MSFSSNKEKISVVGLADRMATFFATDVEGDFFDRSALVWKFGDAAGLDAREIIKEWAIVQMFLRSQVFRKHFKDTKTAESVLDYFHGIPDKQLPQYILVSDFARFRLYDLDNNTVNEFTIISMREFA